MNNNEKSKEELLIVIDNLNKENESLKAQYIKDIVNYKRTENYHNQTEIQMKTIFNMLGTGIVIIDKENLSIIEVNEAAAQIIGVPKVSIIGRECHQFFCTNDKDSCPIKYLGETVENCECLLTLSDGEQKTVIKTIYKMIYKGKECFVESFIDITELKLQEEEQQQRFTELQLLQETMEEILYERNILIDDLAETEEKLTKLNATKDKFFSIISHDLRGPMGTLKSILDMMATDYDSFTKEESLNCLTLMKDSSANLFALLENLLLWSRSQRGLIEIQPVNVNLYNLVEGIISLLKLLTNAKSIKLESHIKPETYVYADLNQLTTLIRNLISNSIKFCQIGGKIIIGFKFTHSNKITIGNSVIFVKDNGIGMDEIIREKLFRIDASITSVGTAGEKGTGLGLILCKDFVDKHGGRIWVKSIVGKGSTFFFSLP
jgi:PAS domain S-box-containing protein